MDVVNKPERFSAYWANLDPTIGSEVKKRRPVLIVSPDSMNGALNTVIVVPLTSTHRKWPTRVNVTVDGKKGQAALDQIRCIDKRRLEKFIETVPDNVQTQIFDVLKEMFEK